MSRVRVPPSPPETKGRALDERTEEAPLVAVDTPCLRATPLVQCSSRQCLGRLTVQDSGFSVQRSGFESRSRCHRRESVTGEQDDLLRRFADICRVQQERRTLEELEARDRREAAMQRRQQQQQQRVYYDQWVWQTPFVGRPREKIRDVEVEVVDAEERKPKQLPPPDPEGR